MPENVLEQIKSAYFGDSNFKLYDHQKKAIEYIDSGKSVIVSVPTASGKSLIAYYGILRALSMGGKAMYIAPLKALVSEKYQELKELMAGRYSVGISTGDYDSGTDIIGRYDVVVCTSEKADSMMHHDPDYFTNLNVLVVDEIHNTGDSSRGPTIEIICTAALHVNPEIQLIGLSATLKNIDEIGGWLNCEIVRSDFRPVPLKKYMLFRGSILDEDSVEIGQVKNDITTVVEDTIEQGGQVLVFLNTRKRAEKFSADLATQLSHKVNADIKAPPEDGSRYSEMLNQTMKHGVAFHHAGLNYSLRQFIEDNFKEKKLKVLTATPTLAAGINLPARTVIIRDLTRFSDGYSSYISNMEIEQMLGRAGRPKYDKFGESYIYCTSQGAVNKVRDFLENGVEPVTSNLCTEKNMGFNILALISTRLCPNMESMESFFRGTLYARQKGEENLIAMSESIIRFLSDNDFINVNGNSYRATEFGIMTSNLYINPRTAYALTELLERENLTEEQAIYHICRTPDMVRLFASQNDMEAGYSFLSEIGESPEDDDDLNAAKTAMVIISWLNEVPILEIEEKFNIGYGDIEGKKATAEWICFAASRLAVKYRRQYTTFFDILSLRMREGIKQEIVSIVAIPNIGRVRARRLFDSGFRGIREISGATIPQLASIKGFSENLAAKTIEYSKELMKRNAID